MLQKVAPTYWAKIYMSGPIEQAKHLLRHECMREGLCVTIEPTTFIYTGGEEAGYVVGLVNYPRFPKEPGEIEARARAILEMLLMRTAQGSAMLMMPTETLWFSRREGDV